MLNSFCLCRGCDAHVRVYRSAPICKVSLLQAASPAPLYEAPQFRCSSLMCIWVFHAAQTFSPDLICLTIPSLNAQQKALCRQLPKAMNVLVNATLAYTDECNWQFRKDRWNCSVGGIPIFASKIAFNSELMTAIVRVLYSTHDGPLAIVTKKICG